MEPITTSAMIVAIVTYLGTHLSKNQTIDTFIAGFTTATVNWIRPFFLQENGTTQEVIKKLKAKPDSPHRQNAVKAALEIGLEDTPEAEQYIQEIFEKISIKNGSSLIAERLEAKKDIELKAKQKNSNAEVRDWKAGGNISFTLIQE